MGSGKAHIVADQSDSGWNVTVSGREKVTVQTSGNEIRITVDPDEDESPKSTTPLDVSLGATA